MKRKAVESVEEFKTGLRASRVVCRDLGVSDTTLWRWSKRGWLRTTNISGKVYVELNSLVDFETRALNGEFSQAPHGAAGKSLQARMTKEKAKSLAAPAQEIVRKRRAAA